VKNKEEDMAYRFPHPKIITLVVESCWINLPQEGQELPPPPQPEILISYWRMLEANDFRPIHRRYFPIRLLKFNILAFSKDS
jgi:hypothetical protein